MILQIIAWVLAFNALILGLMYWNKRKSSNPLLNQSLRPRLTRFKPNNSGNLNEKLAKNGDLMK